MVWYKVFSVRLNERVVVKCVSWSALTGSTRWLLSPRCRKERTGIGIWIVSARGAAVATSEPWQ